MNPLHVHRWPRQLKLLSLGGLMIGSLVTGRLLHSRVSWASPYPYPFQAATADSVTESLNREITFYQERIQQNPTDGSDRAALAQTYLKMGRATGNSNWYLLAEQSARQSLEYLPFHNSTALISLAQLTEAKHDFSQAIELAQQILDEDATNEAAQTILVTSYLATGNVEDAHQIANQLVQALPTLGTFTLRALTHEAQCMTEAALSDFQAALTLEEPQAMGSSARVRTLMGRLYAQHGQLDQAKQLYQDALRILPRYPLALVQLAQLETQQGHYRKAKHLYSKVFTSTDYPTVFDHVALQGVAHAAALRSIDGASTAKQRATAESLWNTAEEQFRQHDDLDSFGHRRELARLLLTRGNPDDVAEALTLMQQEATIRRDPETLNVLAWALLQQDQVEAAQAAIQEAMESQGNGPTSQNSPKACRAETLYRAAQIEEALGNNVQAEQYRQHAEAANPTFNDRAKRMAGILSYSERDE